MEWKHETNEIGSQRWIAYNGSGVRVSVYLSDRDGRYDWYATLDARYYPKLTGDEREIGKGDADTLEEAKAQAEAAAEG